MLNSIFWVLLGATDCLGSDVAVGVALCLALAQQIVLAVMWWLGEFVLSLGSRRAIGEAHDPFLRLPPAPHAFAEVVIHHLALTPPPPRARPSLLLRLPILPLCPSSSTRHPPVAPAIPPPPSRTAILPPAAGPLPPPSGPSMTRELLCLPTTQTQTLTSTQPRRRHRPR
jgi:hypothetical protein